MQGVYINAAGKEDAYFGQKRDFYHAKGLVSCAITVNIMKMMMILCRCLGSFYGNNFVSTYNIHIRLLYNSGSTFSMSSSAIGFPRSIL